MKTTFDVRASSVVNADTASKADKEAMGGYFRQLGLSEACVKELLAKGEREFLGWTSYFTAKNSQAVFNALTSAFGKPHYNDRSGPFAGSADYVWTAKVVKPGRLYNEIFMHLDADKLPCDGDIYFQHD